MCGLFILFICLAACVQHIETHPQATITKDPVTKFKIRVEELREKLAIPGLSLAVLYRQQILFADGFGYANLEKRKPATPETPYNIASLTKTFSAAVLMKLVEEGRLDLDAELAVLLKKRLLNEGTTLIMGILRLAKK